MTLFRFNPFAMRSCTRAICRRGYSLSSRGHRLTALGLTLKNTTLVLWRGKAAIARSRFDSFLKLVCAFHLKLQQGALAGDRLPHDRESLLDVAHGFRDGSQVFLTGLLVKESLQVLQLRCENGTPH